MKKNAPTTKETLFALGVIALGIFWYLKPANDIPTPSLSNSANSLKSPAAVEIIPPQIDQAIEIEPLRRKSLARLNANAQTFKPKIVGKAYQLKFDLRTQERNCVDGDVDVMKSVEGEAGKLLLTLEDDSGTVVGTNNLRVSDLKSKYSAQFSIDTSESLKVLKLSLCSANKRKSCRGLAVLTNNTLPIRIPRSSAKRVRKEYSYYAFSFALIDQEIHLFDATNVASDKSFQDYLAAYNGNDKQLEFLRRTARDQKEIGILPLTLEDDRVVLSLYAKSAVNCALVRTGAVK